MTLYVVHRTQVDYGEDIEAAEVIGIFTDQKKANEVANREPSYREVLLMVVDQDEDWRK